MTVPGEPIKVDCVRRMGNVPLSTLWVNLIVISGTWGSSFVLVKLITHSMHPFAFAASRGFIAMSALALWPGVRSEAPPKFTTALLRALAKGRQGARSGTRSR